MRFTIGKKLAFGFSAIFFLMLLSAVFSYHRLAQLSAAQDELTKLRVPIVLTTWDLRSANNRALADVRGYVLFGAQENKGASSKDDLELLVKRVESDVNKLKEFSKTFRREENRQRVAESIITGF